MKLRYFCFVICLTLVNCKKQQPELLLKYSEKPKALHCDNIDDDLINEALYNFEANLAENYANKNSNLMQAYRIFLKESTSNTANYNNISNQHSIAIFEALKNVEGLWIEDSSGLSPNYSHEVFTCIGDNIIDEDIKATCNALLTTNSMSIRMLKDVLISRSSRPSTDKYLAVFIALELYYSKLSDVDLSQKQKKPLNTELREEKDPHAGHNHS